MNQMDQARDAEFERQVQWNAEMDARSRAAGIRSMK